MKITKFEIKNYKCFTKETQFDSPLLVNLIIGKNNSGKSTFLDIVRHIYCRGFDLPEKVKESFYFEIEKNDVSLFTAIYEPEQMQNIHPYHVPPLNREELIGKTIKINLGSRNSSIDSSCQYYKDSRGNRFSLSMHDPALSYRQLGNNKCAFMKAERNVVSEGRSQPLILQPNGSGLTTILRNHFSNKKGSRKLIESILKELNNILKGEEEFSALRVLEEDNDYTICLENQFGEISLNDMGSGLKTILLVLYHLKAEEESSENSVFMFEEIENNLHPEIQRRLFNTIYEFAIKNKKRVFITSHSHVAINCFYGKEKARIYHVFKDTDKSSKIETIDSDLSKGLILDDLGVKASDIFQSNGIVWVEGPSDRIYINKWLNLVAPDLKEGTHFTYLMYGGKLLSHYSIGQEKDMIDILLTNRNSAIVIDSDIKEEGGYINATKQRIMDSFGQEQRFCWITKGREIENYIHKNVINEKYKKDSEKKYVSIGIYEDFKDYIVKDDPNFEKHKVDTAIGLNFTSESLDVLDLKDRIIELVETIKKWNM